MLNIKFQSAVQGVFSRELCISYCSPYNDSVMWTVLKAPLRASAGSAQITVDPTFLDVGDCRVKSIKRLPLRLYNSGGQDVGVSALALMPFTLAARPMLHPVPDDGQFSVSMDAPSLQSGEQEGDDVVLDELSPNIRTELSADTSLVLDAAFRPRRDGQQMSTICICFSNQFLNVDLFGQGGTLRLNSNLGPPSMDNTPSPSLGQTTWLALDSLAGPGSGLGAATGTLARISEDPPHTGEAQAKDSDSKGDRKALARSQHNRTSSSSAKALVEGKQLGKAAPGAALSKSASRISIGGLVPSLSSPSSLAQLRSFVDLGLGETGRIVKKLFVVTNTGSLKMHIGQINTQKGGLVWSFAHTSTHTVGNVQLHTHTTQLYGMGSSQGLDVHGKSQGAALRATLAPTNALVGLDSDEGANAFDSTEVDEDGFGAVVLDQWAVDWDELDYQAELARRLAGLAKLHQHGSGSIMVTEPHRKHRMHNRTATRLSMDFGPTQGAAAAHYREQAKAARAIELRQQQQLMEQMAMDEEAMRAELPLTLYPGHSLPLLLCFMQQAPGVFTSQISFGCIDDPNRFRYEDAKQLGQEAIFSDPKDSTLR